MKVAFFGDIVGRTGRKALARVLPHIRQDHRIDFSVANVENAAGGFGITEKALRELEQTGIDCFTSGNHVWDKKEGVPLLDTMANLLRPANYPPGCPGRGCVVFDVSGTKVIVLNLQGRVFMPAIDCPFRTASRCLGELAEPGGVIIVDIHAEATSEKVAMGWYLDGRVSLVVGTHTHVPTADARILPGGTGYITDVGMVGAYDSVIGVEKQAIIDKFLSMQPSRFDVAKNDPRCDFVLADIDEDSGRAVRLSFHQLEVTEK